MNILAIESSCDETAAAVLSGPSLSELKKSPSFDPENPLKSTDYQLLSNVVVSQIDIFKEYGGVIPEVAARSHLEAILPVIHQAILDAENNDPLFRTKNRSVANPKNPSPNPKTPPLTAIDAIAVTHTPGLLGSLLIGTLTARTLAILHNKPLYPIHHLKSHIYSAWLDNQEVEFPILSLVVSGGHTQLLYMSSPNSFKIIGTTLDDAVGEAFDKVAKILGLPYPGGPSIANAAKSGDPEKYHFPHPKVDSLNFSFSGLKTAVLRTVQRELDLPLNYPSHDIKSLLSEKRVADFAASFQRTAIDILIEKLSLALKKYHDVNNIIIAGGVSANEELRKNATKLIKPKLNIFFPSPRFSGDNAAMVALAAYSEILSSLPPTSPYKVSLKPRSELK